MRRRAGAGAGGAGAGAGLYEAALRRPVLGHRHGLRTHTRAASSRASVVDIHAEATSERWRWGIGATAAPVWDRDHPCSDRRYDDLNRGTAYQSDAGMCGDYDSVIGMDKAEPLRRFLTGMTSERFTPPRARRRWPASSSPPTTAPGLPGRSSRCAMAGGCNPRRFPPDRTA